MFRQIPPITKNLLIINVLAYLAAVVMKGSGIDFNEIFGVIPYCVRHKRNLFRQ